MKRTASILVAIAVAMLLVGCNAVGTLFNPIIGTWQADVLAISAEVVYDADGTCTETNSLGASGVSKNGTWTSDSSTITSTWSDESSSSYTYSFNSDSTEMTLGYDLGSITYSRQ